MPLFVGYFTALVSCSGDVRVFFGFSGAVFPDIRGEIAPKTPDVEFGLRNQLTLVPVRK